jgi:hypothetical protein
MPEETQAVTEGQGQEPNTESASDAGRVVESAQTVDSLPDWAQGLISELRSENAGHRKAKKAAEQAAQKAEEERLAKQEEWQQLAEQRQARISELEPLSEDVERYKGAVEGLLEAQRKGLPDYVIALLDRLDPVDQLQWIAENGDKMASQAGANINAGDRSDNEPPPEVTDEEIQEFAARMGVDPRFVDKKLLRQQA